MAEVVESTKPEVKALSQNGRGFETITKILSEGLPETPEKIATPQTQVDNQIKELEAKNPSQTTSEAVIETPEQIELKQKETALKEKETQIEAIRADLKLSEKEKAEAITKLTEATKPKKHWEVKEETSETTPDEEALPDTKAWEAKAKEYDEILKDPAVEALISARKSGKDFSTFLKEVQPIDVDKIPLDALMREQLKRENLSAEAIEKEMEDFGELSERAKIRETKEIKATLQSEQQNRLAKYTLDNKQAEIKRQEFYLQSKKEKEQYLESIKGKVKEGVEMTSARLQELSSDFDKFSLFRKDGTLDVPRIMRIHLLEKYNSLRLENAYQQGKTEAEAEAYKAISRPSSTNGIAVVPETKNQNQQSEDAQNMAEFDRRTQIRGRAVPV